MPRMEKPEEDPKAVGERKSLVEEMRVMPEADETKQNPIQNQEKSDRPRRKSTYSSAGGPGYRIREERRKRGN